MTENDKFTLEEFLRGFVLTFGIVCAVIIVIAILSGGEDETLMNLNAEVVDTYKGCDIVRWSTSKMVPNTNTSSTVKSFNDSL